MRQPADAHRQARRTAAVRRLARRGAAPWYDGPPLLDILESIPPRAETVNAPFRFPIQRVARWGEADPLARRGYRKLDRSPASIMIALGATAATVVITVIGIMITKPIRTLKTIIPGRTPTRHC